MVPHFRVYVRTLANTYLSDYNFVKQEDKCVPVGPEPIESGVCLEPHEKYMGSSGFRLIPGNTCDRERGLKKDEKVEKSCKNGVPHPSIYSNIGLYVCSAQPEEGQITHRIVSIRIRKTSDIM